MLTPKEARDKGFTIDTNLYPWVAYKGPRFKPDVAEHCLTDLEEELLQALEGEHKAIDMCLARLVNIVDGFMPSESPYWPAVERGYAAIKKAKALR